jgi:hypothetical protein
MERFYDVTVNGQPMRLELHSTSVAPEIGRVRIDVHPDTSTLMETMTTDVTLQFDPAAQAARAALASVSISHFYPDQSYEEIMRRRAIAQDNPPQ